MTDDERFAERLRSGYAGYSPLVLAVYDFLVYAVNNRFFWKCPTHKLIAHYNAHITADHLEIGLGTGFLLDKCVIPGSQPRLVFCDMNQNCLEKACHRLRRYSPVAFRRNVLEPIAGIGEPFQSVGLNYVLHCLPGDMKSKRAVFEHIAAVLKPGGVLFGATLLGRDVAMSLPARMQMRLLNRRGWFSNTNDGLAELKAGLAMVFAESDVRVEGCAAVFWARTRRVGRPV